MCLSHKFNYKGKQTETINYWFGFYCYSIIRKYIALEVSNWPQVYSCLDVTKYNLLCSFIYNLLDTPMSRIIFIFGYVST